MEAVGAAGASFNVASKHAVEGMTKSRRWKVAGNRSSGERSRSRHHGYGYAHTLHHTDDNKRRSSRRPVKRLASPEEIGSCDCLLSRRQMRRT